MLYGTKQPMLVWLRNNLYISGYEAANTFSVTKQLIYFRLRNSRLNFVYETAERFLGTKRFGYEAAETADLYFGYETVTVTKQPNVFWVRNGSVTNQLFLFGY